MKRLLLFYCLCLPFGLYAQDYPAYDSLLMVDTLRALHHLESKYSAQTDPEQKVRDGLKIVDHYVHVTGETEKALDFTNNIEPFVLSEIPERIVSIEMARAKAYDYGGIFDRAAEHYLKVIDLGKEQEQLELVAVASSNLGILYKFQGQLDQALKYNRLALTYDSLIGDRIGLAADFNNLAGIFEERNELDSALLYYRKTYLICKAEDFLPGQNLSLNNMGSTAVLLGLMDSAEVWLNESIRVKREMGSPDFSQEWKNTAILYSEKNDYEMAKTYMEKAIQHYRKLTDVSSVLNPLSDYADILSHTGDWKAAYMVLKEYYTLKDSLASAELSEKLVDIEAKYENNKKELRIAQQDAELSRKKREAAELDATLKERDYQLLGGLVILLAFFAGGFFVVRANRRTQKANRLIQLQKAEVESQRDLVEEKNKEIIDSINYAKRLQNAIMPPISKVREWLPESFVLYQPKDIVAGDFYWFEPVGDTLFFAAADCTGHGVPGAMVSVVCSNALSKSLIEDGIEDPGKILDRTRELVISRFGRGSEEVNDGMDISLCALDLKTRKLLWSGANNPLWIVRSKNIPDTDPESARSKDTLPNQPIPDRASLVRDDVKYELLEVKADKQPIGRHSNPKPFTSHSQQLEKGDCLYVFSDGYPDQFGGPKGKKFKSSNLKKLLLQCAATSMDEQQKMLEQTMGDWKGALEQVDDVCIIGVRV